LAHELTLEHPPPDVGVDFLLELEHVLLGRHHALHDESPPEPCGSRLNSGEAPQPPAQGGSRQEVMTARRVAMVLWWRSRFKITVPPMERAQAGRRQVRAALPLLSLGGCARVWEILRESRDPCTA